MSEGNESEREGLHPRSPTETIDSEICEDAQTTESQQEDLHLQSLTETIDAKIREDAQKTESLLFSAYIYRVPKELRKLNDSAYTPRLIAIGPLHCNDEHLKSTPMQYVKGSYTNSLLLRLTEGERYRVLEDCVAEMKRSIDDAKKCYAEEVSDVLDAEMLLVDGCFIIELLYRVYLLRSKDFRNFIPPGVQRKVDPILKSYWTARDVKTDLLLIENQIPFFVLNKLFALTIGKIQNLPPQITLSELTRVYFRNMILIGSKENSNTAKVSVETTNDGSPSQHALEIGNIRSSDTYKHILDKVHCDCIPHDHKPEKEDPSEYARTPSASDLDYAGVKFVAGNKKDPFKFKFNKPEGLFWWFRRASFEISPLKIYDSTEIVLRNLIAFEQCCPTVSQHFTSYAFLMDKLVNTEKDVDNLQKDSIIDNCLGSSEDVTKLFNNLCKEIGVGDLFFGDQFKNATKYSERFWPKNMIHLRRTYFASPWKFIAFCVGIIAFVMSIAGSIRSLLEKRK